MNVLLDMKCAVYFLDNTILKILIVITRTDANHITVGHEKKHVMDYSGYDLILFSSFFFLITFR